MRSWKQISNDKYNIPQSVKINNLNCNELIANSVNDNLDVNGDISANGLILYGSTSRYKSAVDISNRKHTYIAFAEAGATTDWAYLRQIGEPDAMNISLDLHDNGTGETIYHRGGFSVRSIRSTDNPDTIYPLLSVRQQDSGRVGIAIDQPTQALDVSGNAFIRGSLELSGKIFSNTPVTIQDKIFIVDNTQSNNDIGYLYYNKDGNLGRNTNNLSSSTEKWKIDANGILTTGSDDRLKEDEEYITDATNTIMKLKPQIYKKYSTFNPNPRDPSENYIIEAGLISQEVFYNVPELRNLVILPRDASINMILNSGMPDMSDPQQDPDYESLGWGKTNALFNYIGLVPYLLKGIQEQQEIIKKQQEDINLIKSKFL